MVLLPQSHEACLSQHAKRPGFSLTIIGPIACSIYVQSYSQNVFADCYFLSYFFDCVSNTVASGAGE